MTQGERRNKRTERVGSHDRIRSHQGRRGEGCNENCPSDNCPGRQLSRWQLSRYTTVQVGQLSMLDNCPGRTTVQVDNCPGRTVRDGGGGFMKAEVAATSHHRRNQEVHPSSWERSLEGRPRRKNEAGRDSGWGRGQTQSNANVTNEDKDIPAQR